MTFRVRPVPQKADHRRHKPKLNIEHSLNLFAALGKLRHFEAQIGVWAGFRNGSCRAKHSDTSSCGSAQNAAWKSTIP